LRGSVRRTGPALVQYVPAVSSVVRAAYASKEKATRKAGGKLLRWTLSALLSTYEADRRSHAPADWADKATLWRKWGIPKTPKPLARQI
jgi:hypothetical protein